MTGDVVGVGGEVELVVAAGLVGGGEEFADDGVEGLEASVGRGVGVGVSPEAVDAGSEVVGVGHGSRFLGVEDVCSDGIAIGLGRLGPASSAGHQALGRGTGRRRGSAVKE